jgi:hypothetical protein
MLNYANYGRKAFFSFFIFDADADYATDFAIPSSSSPLVSLPLHSSTPRMSFS